MTLDTPKDFELTLILCAPTGMLFLDSGVLPTVLPFTLTVKPRGTEVILNKPALATAGFGAGLGVTVLAGVVLFRRRVTRFFGGTAAGFGVGTAAAAGSGFGVGAGTLAGSGVGATATTGSGAGGVGLTTGGFGGT